MCKIRKLIRFYKKSSMFYRYIYNYIESASMENNNIQFKGLIIDMQIRWNSSYLMLKRLVSLKTPVNEITENPEKIPG